MKKTSVTIITPTYNRLPTLKEAVQCVLNQSYKDWEHVVVADGHNPKVEEFIKSLKDKRVKYFFTESTNYTGNFQRNHGLKKAKGKIILFLDDDNVIKKDYLEEILKGFNSKEIGYVICQIKYYDGRILKPKRPFRAQQIDTRQPKKCVGMKLISI